MNLLQKVRSYKNNLNNNRWFYLMVRSKLNKTLKDEITVLEIGTAFGDSSTKSLYRNLKNTGKKYFLIGYEPMDVCYDKAMSIWGKVQDVHLKKKYFLTENAIAFYKEAIALENLEPAIKENILKNIDINSEMLVKEFRYKPDIIFIDSIRYSHLAIVKSIVELDLHKNATIIMEDDIPGFGETAIIQKHFKLRNINRHRCYPHQWPFVTYQIIQ
jgi:hypothetical protein